MVIAATRRRRRARSRPTRSGEARRAAAKSGGTEARGRRRRPCEPRQPTVPPLRDARPRRCAAGAGSRSASPARGRSPPSRASRPRESGCEIAHAPTNSAAAIAHRRPPPRGAGPHPARRAGRRPAAPPPHAAPRADRRGSSAAHRSIPSFVRSVPSARDTRLRAAAGVVPRVAGDRLVRAVVDDPGLERLALVGRAARRSAGRPPVRPSRPRRCPRAARARRRRDGCPRPRGAGDSRRSTRPRSSVRATWWRAMSVEPRRRRAAARPVAPEPLQCACERLRGHLRAEVDASQARRDVGQHRERVAVVELRERRRRRPLAAASSSSSVEWRYTTR